MAERVAVIGVGIAGFRPIISDLSYKEMMYEAAVKAYEDAGVDPRRDVDSFVSCAEDFWEGTSIFDEYVPDQLGAVLRPTCTVTADGLYGLITGYMQILTGLFDVVAVEAHSKASECLDHGRVASFAMDPVYNAPLGGHPYYVAGLEMNRYMHETGATRGQCALVVEKNKVNALDNPRAAYAANVLAEDVVSSEPMFHPLNRLDVSPLADGAIVLVLASGRKARLLSDTPIWIEGAGWCSDTPWLESRDWAKAVYAQMAAQMAYNRAGIREPRTEIDFAEVDDTFSYKELQHMEAARICSVGEAGKLLEEGVTQRDGSFPVNVSGGSLGVGDLLEANGAAKAAEVVMQLRNEAGGPQISGAEVGLALSWRGIPTTSGAAVVFSSR